MSVENWRELPVLKPEQKVKPGDESQDLLEVQGSAVNKPRRTTDSSTNIRLLESLIEGKSACESWPIFVEKYGRLLYRWAMRWGADSHDAEEIMQETLILVFQKLEQYYLNPKSNFRSWLKTVAYRCWLQIQQARSDERLSGLQARMSPEVYRLIISDAARDDLLSEFERVACDEILEIAGKRVRSSVDESSWDCFYLMYFENLSGRQISERLSMSLSAVYSCLSRVRQRLKTEIQRIDDSFEI